MKDAVLDPEVDSLVAALNEGRRAWISGSLETSATDVFAQADDMTIFAPFGGEAAPADPIRQARSAASFKGGTGHSQVVKVMREGELVVIVMVEWNNVQFDSHAEPHPWILRTTQVFRRDRPGHWLRLHRHADPLILRRSLSDTLKLLEGTQVAA
jgi:ketosteroid isomerase-like protein